MEGGDELALIGARLAHGEFDAPYTHPHHDTDLQQSQPDRVRTGTGESRVLQPDTAQCMHEYVGRGGKPQTQLIGPERRRRECG